MADKPAIVLVHGFWGGAASHASLASRPGDIADLIDVAVAG
ncbi:hypothetical protein [Streptomyces niveus]